MEFARDVGANTVMLTGTNEPQQNLFFLRAFGEWNRSLSSPFKWIEIQSSGTCLCSDAVLDCLHEIGVTTISLSLSSLDDTWNRKYTNSPNYMPIKDMCAKIKEHGFNLRISLNLTDKAFFGFERDYLRDGKITEGYNWHKIFSYMANDLGANQATFRVLYQNIATSCPENDWIATHGANKEIISELYDYTRRERVLEILEFGQKRYDVKGLSVVLDDDCMSTVPKESLKYLILRPNGKLYTKWDTAASLLF
jgi:hypothetical protein